MLLLLCASLAAIDLNVWPRPQKFTLTGGKLLVDPAQFQYSHSLTPHTPPHTALVTALAHHRAVMFAQVPVVPFDSWLKVDLEEVDAQVVAGLAPLAGLAIRIEYPDEPLGLAQRGSEAYTLAVARSGEATLEAFTLWGALMGLWTFTQLVTPHQTPDGGVVFLVPCITIDDWPRYGWRGLLVDTSRHYLSISTLKTVIDGLAMNKMNVLHWHLVDAEAFPLQLEESPELAGNGSWTSRYRYGPPYQHHAVYTADDVREVVRYAAMRGVRVMPEIDTPSHVTSWGKGTPGFIACEDLHFAAHAVDPTNEHNYEVLQRVLEEVAELFPDPFMHLGADELNFDCWREGLGKKVAAAAAARGVTLEQLLRFYEERVVPLAESLGRTAVVYADPLGHNVQLPLSAVVHVWASDGAAEVVQRVAKLGHRMLISAGWYLDMQVPSLKRKPRHFFEDTWRDFYLNDPAADAKLSLEEEALVLGGEVCMWGEQVDDTNIISRAFPRTAAAAERMWTLPNCGIHCEDSDETKMRLVRFRCLMVLAGVRGGPLGPDYCPYLHMPPQLALTRDHQTHTTLTIAVDAVTSPSTVLLICLFFILIYLFVARAISWVKTAKDKD